MDPYSFFVCVVWVLVASISAITARFKKASRKKQDSTWEKQLDQVIRIENKITHTVNRLFLLD
jgi:hypothetical protein